MEPIEPMPATRESHAPNYSASIRGAGLSETEMKRMAEVVARRIAERQVRDIFSDYMKIPLRGVASRLNQVMLLALKANRGGR